MKVALCQEVKEVRRRAMLRWISGRRPVMQKGVAGAEALGCLVC